MRNGMSTKKVSKQPAPDEMRPEYDLRGGVRGKYFAEYQKGTNLVLLAPDVAKSFPDSEAVNQALRKVLSEQRVAEKRTKRRAG
jgi:hypothetical protein